MDLATMGQLAPQIVVALVIIGAVMWMLQKLRPGKELADDVSEIKQSLTANGSQIAKLHTKVATIANDVSWLKAESKAPAALDAEE